MNGRGMQLPLNMIIAMVSVCEVAGVQLPVDQLPVDGDGNDTISVVWSRTISEGSKFHLWFQGSSYSYSNLSLRANMTMVVESLTWVEERKGAEVGSPLNWKSVCTTRQTTWGDRSEEQLDCRG